MIPLAIVIDPSITVTPKQAVTIIFGITVSIVMAVLIVRVLGKYIMASMDKPTPSALIVAVTMLTFVALFGGLFTNSESAWAIAASGVGALSTGLLSFFNRSNESTELDEDNLK